MPDGRSQRVEEAGIPGPTALGYRERRLDEGWQLACLPAGAALHPDAIPGDARWIPAPVPGHAIQVAPRSDLDEQDVWYRLRIPPGPPGRRLRFDGLATLVEAWLDGQWLLAGQSMFVAQECALPAGGEPGGMLHLRFRALAAPQGLPRARWRTGFAQPSSLRGIRTTLSGRLAGQRRRPVVGPWRPVALLTPIEGLPPIGPPRIEASLDPDGTGHLALTLPLIDGAPPPGLRWAMTIAGVSAPLRMEGATMRGEIALPGIAPWWPHTHGTPALHDLAVTVGAAHRLELGRIGFRRIAVDHGSDGRGFALRINGEPIFCRGAAWQGLQEDDPFPLLALARDAGLNMIRLPGTGGYADARFHAACDALGLLVWQDFMFARLDYPIGDQPFRALVEAEAQQLLQRLQGSPSLGVLCGGSEVAQQAAMLGLPEAAWSSPLFDEVLPGIAASLRPDVPYVPNAPCGPAGELPFRVDAGIAHDFGIGGYLRPLSHARSARLRFAAECLAFSHLPDRAGTEAWGAVPNTPEWKAGVPRDGGAAWDFEDVREHYLADLYGVSPSALRRDEPEHWLALSRAVSAEVIEAAFAAWRRPSSGCGGALLIALQDTEPGAGWGVVDAGGRAKPAWHALCRACRPVQLLLLDEGLNGIALHVVNDTAEPVTGTLSIDCWRGAASIARGRREVTIPARGALSLGGEALFDGFFDAMGSWRFGPLRHEAVFARLDAESAAEPIATATLFPRGRGLPRRDIGLTAELTDGPCLLIATRAFAEAVQIEDEAGFVPSDDFFHLAPGITRRIALRPGMAATATPRGRVIALNAETAARYGGIA